MKTVAIIGAGPAGLATARVLSANMRDVHLDIFEAQKDVAGVWYYPKDDKAGHVMYDHLETNLPKELMQFSEFPFKDSVPKFPSREEVFEYVHAYFERFVAGNDKVTVHLETPVHKLVRSGNHWILHHGEQEKHDYDYVVVANGHFTKPRFPEVPGLEEWQTQGRVTHSFDFQNCEAYRDRTVLVVGNGSSGSDIANQLTTVAKKVLQSVSDWPEDLDSGIIEVVPKIKKLCSDGCTVELEDGTIRKNIDHIIYATGYYYSLPFLDSDLTRDICGSNDSHASRLHNLWNQLIYKRNPTLAFPLLALNVIPFPLAELQACVISKVFDGIISVQSDEIEPRDLEANYHALPRGEDIEYYQKLQALLDSHGGAQDAFQPVKWDEQRCKWREESYSAKRSRNETLKKHALLLRKKQEPYYIIACSESSNGSK